MWVNVINALPDEEPLPDERTLARRRTPARRKDHPNATTVIPLNTITVIPLNTINVIPLNTTTIIPLNAIIQPKPKYSLSLFKILLQIVSMLL
jgi:hypothetical protein